jgi:REP element-mobilizing transposase RayT
LLRHSHQAVQQRRPFETVAICILPDHIHALWALPDGDVDLSTRWNLIKSGFSRGLEARPRSASQIAKREKAWQRRYWEHAIRNDADLERHVDYIHFNPVNTHTSRAWPTGRIAATIAMSSADCLPRTGGRHAGYSGLVRRMRVGTAQARLCPPYFQPSDSSERKRYLVGWAKRKRAHLGRTSEDGGHGASAPLPTLRTGPAYKPWIWPASISNRLKRRASAPSLQA